MEITPDDVIVFQNEYFKINSTLFFTWVIMIFILIIGIILRRLIIQNNNGKLQTFFEMLVLGIRDQILKSGDNIEIELVFPFISAIFIFVLSCNLIQFIPTCLAPTSSLSTTIALTICVFLFGIFYGIRRKGFLKYLKKYTKPTPIMLPINLISDISGNCALAIRLYGNLMSSMVITAIVSKVVFLTLGFPIFLDILALISSIIQAYIFSTLALTFIMSAEEK